ncbi:endoplasmic oxidoreductin [Dichomitus squalens LYAD-421 SS1]|uniref:endoplasmic oxidoreductin n=1 Tax=Dichomitus squalens (strain LYAD-421) TaxID=732165 RepID=UPI000441147E|nr:endoplasmic oxidoreductin [Dichomitus squalens LYAD-421 SS1]EJF65331.1 endoplasmic oxidoreductin [Dichomitus squalens LYAD-421 SS1]
MFPRHLYALTLAIFFQSSVSYASVSQQSFLGSTPVKSGQVKSVLEREPVKEPACKQFPTGPIETTACDYETVESVTETLYNELHSLVETPFFKFFRADLYRECPFWQENGFCMNRECGITTVDESEIPERWRAAELSKIEVPEGDQRTVLPGCYYRDSDYCFLDDLTEGDYIDLSLNPERFTGYAGPSANRVWKAIYEENCFGLSELGLLSSTNSPSPGLASLPDSMSGALVADGTENSKECLEQRVYYKIVSGLHASISTHICHDEMNQTTGEWGPNLQCFISRVAAYPERLQYIYFDTVLLLRAVARLGPYLSAYDYCATGTHDDDAETYERLSKVIDIARTVGRFDETVLFRGENANVLKNEFKEHFRNVTRIMDCVGCDRCRLWGKVQTTGIATALKVLFELDALALDPRSNANLLQRSEVVALINTLHRLVESLHMVQDFRRMWAETGVEEEARLIQAVESQAASAPKAHRSPVANGPFSPRNFLIDLLDRIGCWVRACRDGTVGCLRGLIDGVTEILNVATSVFRISGKDQGPGRSDL